MNNYELVVLTRTDYGKKISDDVQKSVGEKKKIVKVDDWGVKTLAYKIQKQTEGNYFLFALTLEPTEVSPLDESLRRNENILRHLLVRSEKRKVVSGKSREVKAEEVKPRAKAVAKKEEVKKKTTVK
mgnify:FL=1